MENILEVKEKLNWSKALENFPNFASIGEAIMFVRDGIVYNYFNDFNINLAEFVKEISIALENIPSRKVIISSLV